MISCYSIAEAMLERCELHFDLLFARERSIGGLFVECIQACIGDLRTTDVIVLVSGSG